MGLNQSLAQLLPASGRTWRTAEIVEGNAQPVCVTLLTWYRSQVVAGPVPKAAVTAENFDPKLLPQLAILELLADGELVFRLFGTARRDYYGEELTGKRLRDAQTGEDNDFSHRLYRAVIAEGRPVLTHTAYRIGGVEISYDRVIIPLSDDDGIVRWVLVTVQPVRAPDRKAVIEFGPLALTKATTSTMYKS